MLFNTIEEAIEDLKEGRLIIVVDDEDRENEGDLVCSAQMVTPDIVNFMSKNGRGLICMPCLASRLDELEIPAMVEDNTSAQGTAFTVSIGAKGKITTGGDGAGCHQSGDDRCRYQQARPRLPAAG
jgi:3,4-dihydroxy 2-butanone 4-phosphate synthase/GTP cyclohydrolase II